MDQTISLKGIHVTSPTPPYPPDPPKPIKFKHENLEHKMCDDSELTGFSRPISPQAFNKMLTKELDRLRILRGSANIDNEIIAVNFGKQALLLLLSQPGCEAISFTFVQRIDPQTLEFTGELTLVAGGVEKKSAEQQRAGAGAFGLIGRDVILSPGYDLSPTHPFLFEVAPPTTVANLKVGLTDPLEVNNVI